MFKSQFHHYQPKVKDPQQCRHTPRKKSRRGFGIGRQQYGCSQNYILDWVYKDQLVRTSLVSTTMSSTNVARYCISQRLTQVQVFAGTRSSPKPRQKAHPTLGRGRCVCGGGDTLPQSSQCCSLMRNKDKSTSVQYRTCQPPRTVRASLLRLRLHDPRRFAPGQEVAVGVAIR